MPSNRSAGQGRRPPPGTVASSALATESWGPRSRTFLTSWPMPRAALGSFAAPQRPDVLPFTHDQFLDVFGTYNREYGGIALVLWLLTAASVSLLWKRGARGSRLVATVLVIHWSWAALGYHLALFRRVNPAATWFAALFLVQAGILLWQGVVRARLTFVPTRSPWGIAGAALIAYALLYPALGPLFGLSYPRVPSFGVPCPLGLLTIGLLLMASPRQARIAAVIPLIWTGIAGSAAFLLGIRADLALLPAGAALILQQIGTFRGGRLRVDEDRTLRPLKWRIR